jgi:hypothetical protein
VKQALWFTRWLLIPILAACAGQAAWCDDDVASAPAPLSTETRISRTDTTDLALRSAPGTRTDLTELSAQRWLHSGRASVGVGAGSVSLVNRPNGMLPGSFADGTATPQASGTLLMLGLRYRTSPQSSVYADTARVHGLGLNGEDQVVNKVGIEFKAVKSDWNIGYGGLGMRLAGDARMTLKLRRNGLAVSMKREF